jgi:6-phosphogluconolactonase
LYVSNRAARSAPVTIAGQAVEVFAGGENNIALFSLDPGSGEPRRVDHYDTRGFEPRTFTIEPSGRFLIVANQSERYVAATSGAPRAVPRSVVVFEIGAGGRLSYRSEHTFSSGELFWIGSVRLPG